MTAALNMAPAAPSDPLEALTRCIRDPSAPPPADMEPRRLAIYRRLFYKNLTGFINHAFPRLRAQCGERLWERLARGFLADHVCQTPYFRYIAREFLIYLESEERLGSFEEPPWMLELAHYEWVRYDLRTAANIPPELEASVDPDGDLAAGAPVLSPLLCSLRYSFPVHEIGVEGGGETGERPTWLLAHRDRAHQVHVTAGNEVTARLLQLLDGERAGRAALEQIAAELEAPEVEPIVDAGLDTLRNLRASDVILGARGSTS